MHAHACSFHWKYFASIKSIKCKLVMNNHSDGRKWSVLKKEKRKDLIDNCSGYIFNLAGWLTARKCPLKSIGGSIFQDKKKTVSTDRRWIEYHLMNRKKLSWFRFTKFIFHRSFSRIFSYHFSLLENNQHLINWNVYRISL